MLQSATFVSPSQAQSLPIPSPSVLTGTHWQLLSIRDPENPFKGKDVTQHKKFAQTLAFGQDTFLYARLGCGNQILHNVTGGGTRYQVQSDSRLQILGGIYWYGFGCVKFVGGQPMVDFVGDSMTARYIEALTGVMRNPSPFRIFRKSGDPRRFLEIRNPSRGLRIVLVEIK